MVQQVWSWKYIQDVLEMLKKFLFYSTTRGSFHTWWISKTLLDRRDRMNKGMELWTRTAEHELLFATTRDKADYSCKFQIVNGMVALAKKPGLFLKDSEKLLMIKCTL